MKNKIDTMKTIDLFGEMSSTNDHKANETILGRWTRFANYRKRDNKNECCKLCDNCRVRRESNTYYKCVLINCSRSASSDIRANHVCRFFKPLNIMEQQITKYEDHVKKILTSNKESRDNDNYLFALFIYDWARSRRIPVDTMSGKDLLKTLSYHEDAPNFESISRCRRKLQEKDSTLRGRRYNERQNRIQRETLVDLGYIDDSPQI